MVREDVEFIHKDDSDMIFLVDHAWTFTMEKCRPRTMLTEVPHLLERMENLMQVCVEVDAERDDRVEVILARMWRYANSYRIGNLNPEDSATIWYG